MSALYLLFLQICFLRFHYQVVSIQLFPQYLFLNNLSAYQFQHGDEHHWAQNAPPSQACVYLTLSWHSRRHTTPCSLCLLISRIPPRLGPTFNSVSPSSFRFVYH